MRVLVTCEHGGHDVPEPYRDLFAGREDLLASHRGWDRGALPFARWFSRVLEAPLRFSTTTRLLVDLNRSADNRWVFSEFTRTLSTEERRRVLARWHEPYRKGVARDVAEGMRDGASLLHLAVHTFTPVVNGSVRRTDVGLLYDPTRGSERALVELWAEALGHRLPGSVIRRNDPYRGATDGLTTGLRQLYPDPRYLGIEIEVSQRILDARGRVPKHVARAIVEELAGSLSDLGWRRVGRSA